MNIQANTSTTFAMQQAIRQPQLLIDLLQQSVVAGEAMSKPVAPPASSSPLPAGGSGRLIDIRI